VHRASSSGVWPKAAAGAMRQVAQPTKSPNQTKLEKAGPVRLFIFGCRLRLECFSLKRPVIQAIVTPAALREHDVHAVPDERMRRYAKLSWKSSSPIFCDPGRMLVCLVCLVVHQSVSTPSERECRTNCYCCK
jgi:hypothetical protein